MMEEDYRNVSCGGDPFNFLMSTIKSIQLDIKLSDYVKVMIMEDKFPYTDKIFEKIANYYKLNFVSIERVNNEIHLILEK